MTTETQSGGTVTGFRVIQLKASNIKKLTAVQITPDANVVTLAGENGAGKSSVLDAIEYALAGRAGICEQPIRQGASKGEIVCKLNGLVVTRRFTAAGGTTLQVAVDGKGVQKSPQTILDELVGNLAFDPLSFARMKPIEQLDTLRRLVGIDFTAEDRERETLYSERTALNRDLSNAKGRLTGLTFDDKAPAEEVSVSEFTARLEQAETTNRANAAARSGVTVLESKANATAYEVRLIREEIERLRKQLAAAELRNVDAAKRQAAAWDALAEEKERVASLADVDTAALRQSIADAAATNRVVAANRRYREVETEIGAAEIKVTDMTARMEEIDEAKRAKMAAAKFPLEGLSFDDGQVLYKGVPFSQASSGEQLRISVAAGMALNPKLRVIFIRDGSLLDAHGLKLVGDMAMANDFQIWIEDARSTDPTAVVIEEGSVKAERMNSEL